MYRVISEIEVSRTKLAGSVLDSANINVPPKCDYLKWFVTHIGGTAIRNSASPVYNAITTAGTFTTSFGIADARSWFSIGGLPAGTFSAGETLIGGGYGEASNRFGWAFQADALADTKFFLRIKFYQWEKDYES